MRSRLAKSEGRAAWLGVMAALAGLLALPAAAQWSSDKPPVLGPGDYPPEATEDTPAVKPPAANATAAPQSLQPKTDIPVVTTIPVPAPVQVDSLGKPEGPPVGTLDASNGGLGDHIWNGSERAKAEDLLKRAPLASPDPVFRELVRRIVLTKAGTPPGASQHSFVGLRIEKLLDGGLIDAAGTLAAQASVPDDDAFARLQAGALLLADRASDVCGPDTATRLSSGTVFWMQLRAWCAAVSGDTATAELTKAVLAAQGHSDAAYNVLSDDVLNHKTVPPGPIAHPSEMHIYLLQQAGLPIPDSLARSMGTPVNLLVMRDPRQTLPARLDAAERIVATGAATAEELKAIAAAQELPLSQVANAAVDAPDMPFLAGQLLLRRTAAIETRPAEKAHLMLLALSLGDKAGLAPVSAALQGDIIATLRPSPADPDARRFVRALLLAGRPEAASRWAGRDPVMRAVTAFATRDPAQVAAVQGDLAAFAQGLVKNPPDPDGDRSYKALLLGLGDVLGLPMPPDLKAQAASLSAQMWDGQRPGPGTMRTIEEISLQPDRRGETLLMMLDTIRSIGLRDLAPDATVEFTRLLMAMNQTETARALAMDALAQYVPPPPPPPAVPPAAP